MTALQTSCLITTMFATHLQSNRMHIRSAYFEKVQKRASFEGLMRSELEKFLYEELGLQEVTQAHSLLSKILAYKLIDKCDPESGASLSSISKAILNEQKLIYKYKDIEQVLVNGLASEKIIIRCKKSEIIQKFTNWSNIAR